MQDSKIIIDLGANADQLKKVIDIVGQKLDYLKSKIESIPDGGKGLNKLTREFNTLSKSQQNLIKNLDNLDNKVKGVSTSFSPIVNSSKNATNAITSLSLVAQDLPFGFIGIQNNLPRVIQTFGDLKLESVTTQNALKSLGSALIGPAGLFLGFSAVTAAITFAIQKYGSLSKAIDAVIFNGKVLSKQQQEIVDGVAQEGTKVLTLYGLYQNLGDARDKQAEILSKLNTISPQYFGNLDNEKNKIDGLTSSINKYIDSFIGKIYVETQQKKITELITQYAEKISFLIDNEIELQKQTERRRNTTKNLVKDLELLAETQSRAGDIGIGIKAPQIKRTTEEVIKSLRDDLRKGVEDVFKNVGRFKEFIDIGEIFGEPKKSKVLKEKVEEVGRTVPLILKKQRKEVDLSFITDIEFKEPTFNLSQMMIDSINKMKELGAQFLMMRELMENVFFNPIQDLFTNFFETGKFAFKKFGDSVLKEIQRLVARIIASGIINLLASILVPGGSAAAQAFGMTQGGLGGIIKQVLGGRNRTQEANFGGLQGGLGLTGQVVFRQSGSDLVGVLNRTNATINRVG